MYQNRDIIMIFSSKEPGGPCFLLSTPPIRGLRKVDDLSIHNHFLGVSVGTQLQSHPQNCVELIGLLTKVKVLQAILVYQIASFFGLLLAAGEQFEAMTVRSVPLHYSIFYSLSYRPTFLKTLVDKQHY